MADPDALPPLRDVMPHRDRALLLERVVEHGDEATTCSVEIGPHTWLRRSDGSVPSWVGVEYMAQCIAAHEAYLALAAGRTLEPGFLVRARSVQVRRGAFEDGEELRVRASRLRGRPGLGALTYRCEIRSTEGPEEGRLLLEGTLSVALLAEDPAPRVYSAP